MPVEIERKFLVKNEDWKKNIDSSCRIRQGYLSIEKLRTVRVRTVCQRAFITIKGIRNGLSRPEFEYEIPYNDALEMLDSLCIRPIIEKIRYKVLHNGLLWEVDVFEGENTGLTIAELELEKEDIYVELPDWVGREVSTEPMYSNSNLVKQPYSSWTIKLPEN